MQLGRGMTPEYKIFCDESCHLPHDGCDIMVFGALRCDSSALHEVTAKIKALRQQHQYHQERVRQGDQSEIGFWRESPPSNLLCFGWATWSPLGCVANFRQMHNF